MKTSRNTNQTAVLGKAREMAAVGWNNTETIRIKGIIQEYMQEKLAITVLVITLALFALVMVFVPDYQGQQTSSTIKSVLSRGSRNTDSRVIPIPEGYCGQERHLSGYQREGV